MPIFEYRCSDCATEFEKLVRAGDAPECPKCHSVSLEKKLSVFATAGSDAGAPAAMPSMGSCGSCGHPGGPGACAFD